MEKNELSRISSPEAPGDLLKPGATYGAYRGARYSLHFYERGEVSRHRAARRKVGLCSTRETNSVRFVTNGARITFAARFG